MYKILLSNIGLLTCKCAHGRLFDRNFRKFNVHPYHSTQLQGADVIMSMNSPKVALHLLSNRHFSHTSAKTTQCKKPQTSLEVCFNEGLAIALATVPQVQHKDVTENLCRVVEHFPGEKCIGEQVKATVKQLVARELARLIEGQLDNILRLSYHNT